MFKRVQAVNFKCPECGWARGLEERRTGATIRKRVVAFDLKAKEPLYGEEREVDEGYRTYHCANCGFQLKFFSGEKNPVEAGLPDEALLWLDENDMLESEEKLIEHFRVDWPALRVQKEALVKLASDSEAVGKADQARLLDGLIHLLDAIQDRAEKDLGEEAVFGKEKE